MLKDSADNTSGSSEKIDLTVEDPVPFEAKRLACLSRSTNALSARWPRRIAARLQRPPEPLLDLLALPVGPEQALAAEGSKAVHQQADPQIL